MPARSNFRSGQRVAVSGKHGTVRFMGVTQFAAGVWCGIEFDDPIGRNDGSVQGVSYFECRAEHGIFVRPAQVQLDDSPREATTEIDPDDQRDVRALVAEGARLTSQLEARGRELAVMRSRRQALQREVQGEPRDRLNALRLELQDAKSERDQRQTEFAALKSASDAHAARAKVSAQTRDARDRLGKATSALAELRQQQDALVSKRRDLTVRNKDLEHKLKELGEEIARTGASAETEDEALQLEIPRIRLKVEIEMEDSQRALAEVQVEELELELNELEGQEGYEGAELGARKEAGVVKYQQALRQLYDAHHAKMRQMRRRAGELERERGRSQAADEAAMQRSIEQLAHQNEVLAESVDVSVKAVEERKRLQDANHEMVQVQELLQAALAGELTAQDTRERDLNALARHLALQRLEQRQRCQAKIAAVARLEVRLQTAGSRDAGKGSDLALAKLESQIINADTRAVASTAEAWSACLPPEVREEALGHYQTLCALSRSFHKARILTDAIHEYYVQDIALALLPGMDEKWPWLCGVCLASAQVAHAIIGILGRLQAWSDRFPVLSRLPALRSCAEGEKVLNAALVVLMGGAWGDDDKDLLALRALSAQLTSLQASVFQDEFTSFQSAACVVEMLRAVCALALYASVDSGGSRRQAWQDLCKHADHVLRRLRGLVETEEGAEVRDPTRILEVHPAESLGSVLDGLAMQVSALESYVRAENTDDMGDLLDRALVNSETALQDLEMSIAEPLAPISWPSSQGTTRKMVDHAITGVDKLRVVQDARQLACQYLQAAATRLAEARKLMLAVERDFSVARVEAEESRILKSSVDHMTAQAQFHVSRRAAMEADLRSERLRKLKAESSVAETQKQCRELQRKLAECERRVAKRFSTQIAPDRVFGVRDACKRQHQNFLKLGQPRAAQSEVLELSEVSLVWDRLREAQQRLLSGLASSQILALDGEAAAVDNLSDESSALCRTVTDLFCRAAGNAQGGGPGEISKPCDRFATIALARHFATARPVAKLTLPGEGVFTVLADLDHIQSLHSKLC